MDLRQIRQFTVLAEELNFRKAAQRLHISQPPLSAAIRRLEEHVGARLFERNQHAVTLTAAGEVFLVEARRLLGQVHDAIALTRSAAQGVSGLLRVSCIPSAFLDLLPATLKEFHRTYPQVRVTVTRELSARQLEGIQQKKVDVAILIPHPEQQDKGLRMIPLRDEQFVLACPSEHRLARQPTVRMQDIEADPLISFFSLSDSPGFSGPLMKAFKASALNPNLMHDHAQWGTNLVMVAGGFGLVIVPRPMRAFGLAGLSYVDLVHDDGSPITYAVAAAVSADVSNPIAENFLAILSKLGEPAPQDC